jgi:microsomal dipeptidase-like Zn-dependent dipeptidase
MRKIHIGAAVSIALLLATHGCTCKGSGAIDSGLALTPDSGPSVEELAARDRELTVSQRPPCNTILPPWPIQATPHLDLRPGHKTPLTIRTLCVPFTKVRVDLKSTLKPELGVSVPPHAELAAISGEVTLELSTPASAPAQLQPLPVGDITISMQGGEEKVEVFVAKELLGLADVHNHQFANHSYGGSVVYGSPAQALADMKDCSPHLLGARIAGGMMGIDHGAGFVGAPNFPTWPEANNWTHQGVQYEMLQQAWQKGLRLLVMLGVENKLACDALKFGAGCNDSSSGMRQICAARALEGFVDTKSGGKGKGWYRIAHTPAEARQIIADGKLAVVLGLEVDRLLGCTAEEGPSQCTPERIKARVQTLSDLGVRHVFPIHFWSNAFGGAAISNPLTGPINNDTTEICSVPLRGYSYVPMQLHIPEFGAAQSNLSDADFPTSCSAFQDKDLLGLPKPLKISKALDEEDKARKLAAENKEGTDERVLCTKFGLTDAGKTLIDELMRQGIMIDVDHMSDHSFDDTLAATAAHDYPVVAGHAGFLEISVGQRRHEGNMRLSEVKTLRDTGSFLGIITNQGESNHETLTAVDGGPACDNSSEGFLASYRYLDGLLHGLPIAVGTDFNGGIGQPAGRKPCPGFQRTEYPIPPLFNGADKMERPKMVNRELDVNEDGIIHIGLLPDFVADVRAQLPGANIDPLINSADGYISAWEQAERVAKAMQ